MDEARGTSLGCRMTVRVKLSSGLPGMGRDGGTSLNWWWSAQAPVVGFRANGRTD